MNRFRLGARRVPDWRAAAMIRGSLRWPTFILKKVAVATFFRDSDDFVHSYITLSAGLRLKHRPFVAPYAICMAMRANWSAAHPCSALSLQIFRTKSESQNHIGNQYVTIILLSL